MGNNFGGTMSAEERAEKARDRKIRVQNKKDYKEQQALIKVLLLGTGGSGKSTIFKQAKKLFGTDNFDYRDAKYLSSYRQRVIDTLLTQLQQVTLHLDTFDSDENRKFSEYIHSINANERKNVRINADFVSGVMNLWNDFSVQKQWRRRAEIHVLECLEYFVQKDALERMAFDQISFEDVLQSREQTLGVTSAKFMLNDVPFEILDVGGQKSERRKWMGCFDIVTTVIYVVAINEYDENLVEDEETNRVEEALEVWKETVNRGDYNHIGFLLFFNKIDLFRRKVCEIPFKVKLLRNDGYKGADPMNFANQFDMQERAIDQCAQFTKQRFIDGIQDHRRLGAVKAHFTCATDSENMNKIFSICEETILRMSIKESGFVGMTSL